jgi:hypothetical protein
LWRKRDEQTPQDTLHPQRPGAKNRPTPKRRDQEAANRRPLVPPDRKSAAKADRTERRARVAATRQAMVSGDESKMPSRDRGPDRRYIRDFVDARFSVGEVMLPVMLLVLLLSLVKTDWALMTVFIGTYGLLLLGVTDAWAMWRKLKRQLVAKFGLNNIQKGGAMYAAMRAFQIRRTRLPRPQVARGQYPS